MYASDSGVRHGKSFVISSPMERFPPLMAIFPFTDSDLVKIEYEFSAGIMNMVSKFISGRFEKSSRYIKPWILLRNTFGFKKLVRVTPEKRINPSLYDTSLKSLITLM
jgi:hypothetical protein